ncbi:hypothetical protein BGZ63DRAFT_464332 [Mariannaea sp. PMI_226]|nr:hypothetical protein BGZ63DRAFT_464332 [Mariannaea sp. PMI_226]
MGEEFVIRGFAQLHDVFRVSFVHAKLVEMNPEKAKRMLGREDVGWKAASLVLLWHENGRPGGRGDGFIGPGSSSDTVGSMLSAGSVALIQLSELQQCEDLNSLMLSGIYRLVNQIRDIWSPQLQLSTGYYVLSYQHLHYVVGKFTSSNSKSNSNNDNDDDDNNNDDHDHDDENDNDDDNDDDDDDDSRGVYNPRHLDWCRVGRDGDFFVPFFLVAWPPPPR